MPISFKTLLAAVLGFSAGIICTYCLMKLNNALFPTDIIIRPNSVADISTHIRNQSTLAMFGTLFAHLSLAAVGSLVAAFIDRSEAIKLSLIIATISSIACIQNMMSYPYPNWMWIEIPLTFPLAVACVWPLRFKPV